MNAPFRHPPRKPARVVSNPEIMGGTPVVEGTRVPAGTVLAEYYVNRSAFDVFRHYPSLPPDGLEACLAWERAGRPDERPVSD